METKLKKKENSESIYYDIEFMKNKKWFEIDDLMKNKELNPLIFLYMVVTKKGVGKTYAMRGLMKQAEQENNKFIFVRRLKDDLKEQASDWETLEDWDYRIIGSKIINIKTGEIVGITATVSTLYNQTGKEFSGYKYVFFDEYKDKRGIKSYVKNEFNKFTKFLIDFQRSKKEIKVFMFANDESRYDAYTEGLNINPDVDYFIDIDMGFFYLNTRNMYQGAVNKENTLGYKLNKYNESILDELDNNATVFQDDANMSVNDTTHKQYTKYQFYLNKVAYGFILDTTDNVVIIKSLHHVNPDVFTYSMTSVDKVSFPNSVKPVSVENVVRNWCSLLSANKLRFVRYQDKLEIEGFIKRVIGYIPN